MMVRWAPVVALARALVLLACSAALLRVRAGPPMPLSVSYDVRRASVGTVALQHTLEWWEYEFAVIDVVFDQSLYLSYPSAAADGTDRTSSSADSNSAGVGTGAGSGSAFNASFRPYRHHHASPSLDALHNTMTLSCGSSTRSSAGGSADGGGSFAFPLHTDWPGDYYTNTESLLPRLLPYYSAANPYRSLFRIFDVFRDPSGAADDGVGSGTDAAAAAVVRSSANGGNGIGGGGIGSGGATNSLSLMLMLSYAAPGSSSGGGGSGDTGSRAKRFIEQHELSTCTLQYTPVAQRQTDADTDADADADAPQPAALTNFKGQEVKLRAALKRSAVPCLHRTVLRLQQYDESSSLASWHSYYASHPPPSLRVPNDTTAGGAAPGSAVAMVSGSGAGPQSLLQTRTEAQLPGIMMVFKPIFSGVLKPVVKSTTIYMCDFWIMTFTDKLFHDVIDEVVPDLTVMLGTVLDANLTNILSDSLTYSVTKSISVGLARTLAPYLTNRVSKALVPRLHSSLNRVLIDKIPLRLRTHVPTIVSRVVQLTLTHALTRSVTHAVVPALTHALPHTKQMDVYCHSCYYHKVDRHCSLCHFSPQSVYYQLYHAVFFSDYYSDYYADYYAHTLQELQSKLWPEVNGEEP